MPRKSPIGIAAAAIACTLARPGYEPGRDMAYRDKACRRPPPYAKKSGFVRRVPAGLLGYRDFLDGGSGPALPGLTPRSLR